MNRDTDTDTEMDMDNLNGHYTKNLKASKVLNS
jgi:hypothetical protein